MITGYNTDVRYREKVFHVQTEDKGLNNPTIESVVYIGGQVLLAKRSSYADLVAEGKGADDISERMEQQHRMMIAAIRASKLDDRFVEAGVLSREDLEVGTPEPPEGGLLDATRDEDGPSLDQVILDYLTTEAQQDILELRLEGGDGLKSGSSCDLQVVASSGKSGLPVSGAKVSVRMISTVREPLTIGEGTTDEEEGVLDLAAEIPSLERGAAAVIVSATSLIGAAELKFLL